MLLTRLRTRRPRRPSGATVSLFSFLDILACVIGVLTLIIITLILSMVRPPAVRVGVDAGDSSIREALAAVQREADALDAQIAQLDLRVTQRRIDQRRAFAARARTRRQRDDAEAHRIFVERREETMRVRLATLEADAQQAAKRVEAIQGELARRREPREAPTLHIRPGGTGRDLDPFFVEVRADAIVLFDQSLHSVHVPAQAISRSALYHQMIQAVAARPNRSIIYLIRPDAVETYKIAATLANLSNVRNGKLPVPADGKIDLSAFKPDTAQP